MLQAARSWDLRLKGGFAEHKATSAPIVSCSEATLHNHRYHCVLRLHDTQDILCKGQCSYEGRHYQSSTTHHPLQREPRRLIS